MGDDGRNPGKNREPTDYPKTSGEKKAQVDPLTELREWMDSPQVRAAAFTAEMRQQVHQRVREVYGREHGRPWIPAVAVSGIRHSGHWLIAALAVALVVFILVRVNPPVQLSLGTPPVTGRNPGSAGSVPDGFGDRLPGWLLRVDERSIEMDGVEPAELVTTLELPLPSPGFTFPLSLGDKGRQGETGRTGLLAIIWSASHADGDWRVVYSETLNGTIPLPPVQVLSSPEPRRNLVVFASRDGEGSAVYYRVLGYNGEAVTTYLDETFEEPDPGIVDSGLVTVLYGRDARGDPVVLPGREVHLLVGQYVVFVPMDDAQEEPLVEVGGALSRTSKGLRATQPGVARAVLDLDGADAQTIVIDLVVEPYQSPSSN